jgi:quercetin dioxygenase-like cupin family protein
MIRSSPRERRDDRAAGLERSAQLGIEKRLGKGELVDELRGFDCGAVRVAAAAEGDALLFPWGHITWLCSGERLADAETTFGYVEIRPGMKNPKHLHPNSDEVLFLIEGELDHSLGNVKHHLTAGMAIHIPRGVEHDAVNTSDRTARMVVSYPTPDRQVVFVEAESAGQE